MNNNNAFAITFERVLRGPPVELSDFEKEISRPMLLLDAEVDADVEDIIADAIMRRSCNPVCIHLRLKEGFQPQSTLTRNELYELSSLPCNLKARELARFYARIANLRSHIMQEQAQQQQQPQGNLNQQQPQGNLNQQQPQGNLNQQQQQQQQQTPDMLRLQRAYATQMEIVKNKQRENQEHLDRIMRAIVLHPDQDYRCIHPQLTNAELDALELQLADIMERGCASNQLRCMKITEAIIEQQLYEALMAELDAL
jgi:hypothetical protein